MNTSFYGYCCFIAIVGGSDWDCIDFLSTLRIVSQCVVFSCLSIV